MSQRVSSHSPARHRACRPARSLTGVPITPGEACPERSRRSVTRWLIWLLGALLLAFTLPAHSQATATPRSPARAAVARDGVGAPQAARPGPTPTPGPAGAGYVGADTCKTCHEEIFTKHFEQTPHFALIKENKHGCEDCHGPGQAHVEGGGDPTKIISFKRLSVAQASARCLSCHQSSLEQSNFARSVHLAQGVGCTSCHSPHYAKEGNHLMRIAQPQLCYGCHATQKAEFARPFRHRVEVGLIQCTDCHNPHGSFVERQLRTNAAGDFAICTKCHTETQGPFVFEHRPLKTEGCTSCHTPHGSTNARLLRVSNVNVLCMQCHTPVALNAGVPGVPSFHNQANKYQACTMCHNQIHGSNFDEFFFR